MNRSFLLFIFFLGFATHIAQAQHLLEKRISVQVNNVPIDKVLQRIENLGGFSFSYSPDVIEVKRNVTINASQQTVREILNDIFKGKVSYKERKKYVILQNKPIQEEKKAPANFNLDGYVIDQKTGEKLANASIYESATLVSTISNDVGYYKIRLPTAKNKLRLEVRKAEYLDVTIPIPDRKDGYLAIQMNPDTSKPLQELPKKNRQFVDSVSLQIPTPIYKFQFADSTQMDESRQAEISRMNKLRSSYQRIRKNIQNTFASARQNTNIQNINDTLYSSFQASILPFLSTNGSLSGNVVNKLSFNLLAGYSLGVQGFEMGAVFNAVRGNVRGFQLAGAANFVGNHVTGFQYANMLNLTIGNLHGFQISQMLNYTGGNLRGMQLAGVGNVVAGTVNGYQLSGVYNYANIVESGHQIGVVNYANYSKKIPFGLFSYVRHDGYRRYEFGSNEFDYVNFSFKTGVSRFYNIFSVGVNARDNQSSIGTMGYGFGTAQSLGKGWMVNADGTGHIVLTNDQTLDEIKGGILKLTVGIEKKLGSRFALFAGPTLNLFISDSYDMISANKYGLVKPIWLGETPQYALKQYTWIGFQGGIRFCNK